MLTAAGIAYLVGMAARLGGDPVDFAGVAASESGLQCWAHNQNGHAAGLFQLMPATAKGLGYDVVSDPLLNNFCKLSDVEQLRWFEKYFSPHRGQLTSEAAVYTATFLPADTAASADPHHVLARCGGFRDWAYGPNKGFDVANKGYIEVADLTAAIERAKARLGPSWTALETAIRAAQAPAPDSVG